MYGLEMCNSFAAVPTRGGSSISTYVFVFGSTEKVLSLRALIPLAGTVVTLRLAHLGLVYLIYNTICAHVLCVQADMS
jgi:hypothetical protein